MRMTTEEAFVKVLQMHGIEHAFGIIGSAFMPISDLFPRAGITFWDCAHEGSGGMMADGYTRASGKMSMMIAQNGPGITNFVTAVKTAYWNHTPLLLVTPQAANKTIGMGGFQEVEQIALFQDMVAYQEEVRDPARGTRCAQGELGVVRVRGPHVSPGYRDRAWKFWRVLWRYHDRQRHGQQCHEHDRDLHQHRSDDVQLRPCPCGLVGAGREAQCDPRRDWPSVSRQCRSGSSTSGHRQGMDHHRRLGQRYA